MANVRPTSCRSHVPLFLLFLLLRRRWVLLPPPSSSFFFLLLPRLSLVAHSRCHGGGGEEGNSWLGQGFTSRKINVPQVNLLFLSSTFPISFVTKKFIIRLANMCKFLSMSYEQHECRRPSFEEEDSLALVVAVLNFPLDAPQFKMDPLPLPPLYPFFKWAPLHLLISPSGGGWKGKIEMGNKSERWVGLVGWYPRGGKVPPLPPPPLPPSPLLKKMGGGEN